MPDEIKYSDDMATQLKIRDNILNNMDVSVYVSDLATNEILFANKALQKRLNDYSLAGRICWEVIENKVKRCDFCRIPYLLKNLGKNFEWKSTDNNRIFQTYDAIIPWSGGKLAHLRYMIEIT